MTPSKPPQINPKKLLLSKWTALNPVNKEKHFIVTELLLPEQDNAPIELITLQAVYSQRDRVIAWRELRDTSRWQQGWV